MADLSDRIADVRRKAVGLADVEEIARLPNREWYERKAAYTAAASPDLIIQMADRIEELEKEREEAVLVREYAHRVTAAAARNKALDEVVQIIDKRYAPFLDDLVTAILSLKSKEPKP
jgi:hypothetical protein